MPYSLILRPASCARVSESVDPELGLWARRGPAGVWSGLGSLPEATDPDEAWRIGLVHEVVPLAELAAAGERVVNAVLENGPEAVAQTKALTLQSAFGDLDGVAFSRLIESHAAKRQSDEAAEGLASFVEKRAARFVGR